MPKVKVVTSDNKIWNASQVQRDIIQAGTSGSIVIDLLSEGPCCVSAGLEDMLVDTISYFGYDPAIITILTANQVPSSQFSEYRMPFVELDLVQTLCNTMSAYPHIGGKRFGLFVGRSNWIRLGLASHLAANHHDMTEMTFHYDRTNDYHSANFGLEELLNRSWIDRSCIYSLLEKLPLKDRVYDYPILWNQEALNLAPRYKEFFCEIVCETYFSGKTFFVTEKTWRPIMHRKPFIVQGPQWFLKNLHNLGFKTFGHWWDEGYDEDPADSRLDVLKTNIDWIADQNQSVIDRWYREMQSILEHNFQTLQKLTKEKIINTVFHYG
jgi:hypothetical protein